ncbi:MAG: universal stress protein [Desulfomonilia bacterium]|jgi:nucleotide-binding universal stress UspA family protein
MFTPKDIVVATDFSEHANRALASALDIASKAGARVHLVHVVDRIQQCVADYCIERETMDQIERQSIAASREKLEKETKDIASSRGVNISYDVRVGVPYEEIIREQEEKNADLIVIASHGRTGLMGHLTGSVADKVLHHAKCPVLLVR